MKVFIQDKERILDSANDLLKTSVYAENLVEVIDNTPKNKVFTIGVFGGWGTGKSSIIRTAQNKIETAHKVKVKFITYDAWKYANDSFRRMFLLKVQQELNMRQTEEMSRFYQSEIAETEPKTKLSAKGLAIADGVLIILSIILFIVPGVKLEWQVAFPTIGTLGTFLVALLNGCFYDLKISYTKPALFAPEQFEECFKQMMSKCLKDTSWFKKKWEDIKDYVEVGEVSVKGLEKLVIVIDNIDRCPSDMAYQLLTDIKTFLSNEEYNLVFVVPVDDEALKKHLFRKLDQKNYDIDKEKEEFLRKFFNVTLRIKPHQETELHHFAHEINRENNLGYSNETLSIVAKEFADNPRRIIQLLNNLSSDLALYDQEFVSKYETAISVALILQEVYPDFYKRATKDLNLAKHFDSNGESNGEKDDLKGFMRIAGYALKKVPIEDLGRIFTNTASIFSDLPADMQKSVRSYDVTKVIEFANANDNKKTTLVDYAIESLSTEVKYGATSQTTQWIDFLSRLYMAGVFDASKFSAIDTTLSGFYQNAIPETEQPEALCQMASKMNKAGIPSLRNAVVGYLNGEKAQADENFENILKAYYVNLSSDQDCKDIAKVVENYYDDKQIDKDIEYTDIQKKILFGDSFVTSQINGLSATDDEARIEDIIWCIKNNEELSRESFTTLFAKFIELFGNTRGKGKSEYLTLINHLQVIFDALPTKSRGNELNDIYGVVINARGIPHPSWPSQPQHDSKKSILDELDAEEAKVVTGFCYEVMRITGGIVGINGAISKLYPICKKTVIEGALKIHSLGISIAPLAGTLIKADDFNSVNDLNVLEIIMSRQVDGTLIPNEDTVKEKIQTLVDNADKNGVENLLGKLVNDTQIKNMMAEYVASLDSETINSLPPSISRYAVSTFNKDNAEVYKDNTDFLILVLQQGNAIQMKEVVRLMKDKINHEIDIKQVVTILNHLETENQQVLKSLVSELDGVKDSGNVSDETKAHVATLTTKLSASIKKKGLIDNFIGKK
ncbi:MAG: hypothetical protein IJS62_03510 [Bacteroidales bacterium]|nr:hypothetical protein [Bacteroidales bacterium]